MIQLKLLSTTLSQTNQILTQILYITSIRKFDSIPQNSDVDMTWLCLWHLVIYSSFPSIQSQ